MSTIPPVSEDPLLRQLQNYANLPIWPRKSDHKPPGAPLRQAWLRQTPHSVLHFTTRDEYVAWYTTWKFVMQQSELDVRAARCVVKIEERALSAFPPVSSLDRTDLIKREAAVQVLDSVRDRHQCAREACRELLDLRSLSKERAGLLYADTHPAAAQAA